ncbi:pentapeptide repeat-containing protein [Nonomuraea sp. CA-141351]|uniref:pentapeptide repeat-containing protein n=1 Tax=Nonomuraea sp. CA-141351 TaxID=3239996 RepID=UPI003D94835F
MLSFARRVVDVAQMAVYRAHRRFRPSLPAWLKRIAVSISIICVVVLSAIVVWNGPLWFDEALIFAITDGEKRMQAVASSRATLLQIFLAFGGFATVIFTARTYVLSRSGQVADRYTKATTQLVSDSPAERIGAVYSLARLFKDSPRDHRAVVDLLASFVRQSRQLDRGTLTNEEGLEEDGDHESGLKWVGEALPVDVQTALTVIAKRPRRFESPWILLGGADLAGASLTGGWIDMLHFQGCNLGGADLVNVKTRNGVVLDGCDLRAANLSGANLRVAHLSNSNLQGAYVRWVDLRDASLIGSDFRGSVLRGSNLSHAYLADADFRGVDLSEVKGLTADQLADAIIDGETVLPKFLDQVAASLQESEEERS